MPNTQESVKFRGVLCAFVAIPATESTESTESTEATESDNSRTKPMHSDSD